MKFEWFWFLLWMFFRWPTGGGPSLSDIRNPYSPWYFRAPPRDWQP